MSFSRQRSRKISSSRQDVSGQQSPYLQDLYSRGAGVVEQGAGDIAAAQQGLRQFAGQVQPELMSPALASFQAQFGEGNPLATTAQQLGPQISQALTQASAMPGQDPRLEASIQQALGGAAQGFEGGILSALQQDPATVGQRGSARGGVGTQLATEIAGQQAEGARTQRLAEAFGPAQANRLAAAQIQQGLLGQAADTATQASQVAQALGQLGQAPSLARAQAANLGFTPLQAQAGLVGPAQVMTTSAGRTS